MNPRKRRTIARALMSGIPSNKLNNETIRAFLNREKSNLNINDDEIAEFSDTQTPVVEAIASTITTNTTEDSDLISAFEEIVQINEPEVENSAPIALKVRFSLKNTKKELLAAANNLGLEFKNSFSKSKLLELINNN